MAFATGTATNYLDLYTKLRDFLKTNAALVAASQQWTQIAGPTGVLSATDEIVLQGPGLAASDQILVAIKPNVNVGADQFNLGFIGLTIYNAAVGDASAQVNNSGSRYLYLWDDVIDYWFVANGRRFIVVARAGSSWFAAYCGLILPFVLPGLYPYPLFIGACDDTPTFKYNTIHAYMRNFFDPGLDSSQLLMPDVTWLGVQNRDTDTNNNGSPAYGLNTAPWVYDLAPLRDNLDGTYPLVPVRITSVVPYGAQMGRMDGVFKTSGFSNSAGSTITFGGVSHLVVPNIYRTTDRDFAAIALE